MGNMFDAMLDEVILEMKVKELKETCFVLYTTFNGLVEAGFTREEAMFIVVKVLEVSIGDKK